MTVHAICKFTKNWMLHSDIKSIYFFRTRLNARFLTVELNTLKIFNFACIEFFSYATNCRTPKFNTRKNKYI